MTELLLVGLVLSALGLCGWLASKYGRLEKEVKLLSGALAERENLLKAFKAAIEREVALRKKLDEINDIKTADEINKAFDDTFSLSHK